MNREEKAAVIEKLAGEIRDADAVFAVDYRGISVPQAAELRSKLRDADARFRVVKNSLTERAADQAGVEGLRELLSGPTALTFVRGDAALAAKALNDAARETQVLEFKGGVMNGSSLSADDIRSIARLPARQVLYGQLVGVVASPVSGLVRGLSSLLAGVAIALKQAQEEGKLGRAAASAAGEPVAPEEAEVAAEPESAAEPEPSEEAQPEPASAVQEAAEQPNPDDPDAEPHEPVVGPDQAEGEDPTPDPAPPDSAVPVTETQTQEDEA